MAWGLPVNDCASDSTLWRGKEQVVEPVIAVSHRVRLISSHYIFRHKGFERINERQTFFTCFAKNCICIGVEKTSLKHCIHTVHSFSIFRTASLNPIDIPQSWIVPTRTMQTTQFAYREACLLYATTSDLISLFTGRHIFENNCDVATIFVPVGKVTIRHTHIEALSDLVVKFHFSFVITQCDASGTTSGIWRCQLHHH
ncbi:unannotated protein [freshwater metagenome]|uniref:Unannotated protein n=1 Tax=freshwater metagenome TaxID=449393 RepID=A0A6J6HFU8_9ZZZZ